MWTIRIDDHCVTWETIEGVIDVKYYYKWNSIDIYNPGKIPPLKIYDKILTPKQIKEDFWNFKNLLNSEYPLIDL